MRKKVSNKSASARDNVDICNIQHRADVDTCVIDNDVQQHSTADVRHQNTFQVPRTIGFIGAVSFIIGTVIGNIFKVKNLNVV
jgi:hypothetical protein